MTSNIEEKISELILAGVVLDVDGGQPYIKYDDDAAEALITLFNTELKTILDDVIGEDEVGLTGLDRANAKNSGEKRIDDMFKRDELRAQQRQRANKYIGVEDE